MKQLQVHASRSYDILIGSGLLADCGTLIKAVSTARKAIIVTDDNVAPLYQPTVNASLQAAGFLTETFVFPHGEASKSHATLLALYDFLADQELTRGDLLVALGGGVVGDLTGYCAATYLRGMDFVQLPTTLLAQIDSSVGGKTAVDTSRGKNLVGAFHQPIRVICDIDTLNTLSPEIFSDGMAEGIKYGLIRDRRLFDRIAEGRSKLPLEEMVTRCIEIKAEIVEADEFDRGERMLLNFGHTLGHAIERAYHYKTYTHGAAVGVGMVYLSALFEREGITPAGTTEKIKNCLLAYRLPTEVEITPEELYTHSAKDKKRDKDEIRLVVLEEIGKATLRTLSLEEYRGLLAGLLKREKRMKLTPAPLSGTVTVPPSKSYAHRALIAAALAEGTSVVKNISLSQDINATLSALRAIGAEIRLEGDTAIVKGGGCPPDRAIIDCAESGSTLRFLIPLTAALGVTAEYRGTGRLPARPLSVYHTAFQEKGISFTPQVGMPFVVAGRLAAGRFVLAGDVSSQFVTGLLFALPLLSGESEIYFTTPLASKGYVTMTMDLLARAGIVIHPTRNGYRIPGNQRYQPFSYTVEGDYSQAAFFLVAGGIGQPIRCEGLIPDSLQGDRQILTILEEAGASVEIEETAVTVSPNQLNGFSIDGGEIPDLVPILAVLAGCCQGESHITNIGRLKLKESDRIRSTADLLRTLGVTVKEEADALTISGRAEFTGGTAESYQDHRIAMATAIATIRAEEEITLSSPDCVNKSFPDFYEKYNQLGGQANVIFME